MTQTEKALVALGLSIASVMAGIDHFFGQTPQRSEDEVFDEMVYGTYPYCETHDTMYCADEYTWDELILAMIQVESQGNPNAVGKHGDWGILQITPGCVKEVNRLTGKNGKKYTHEDAFDPEKSIEMFNIIARKYVPVCHPDNYEKMARIWNGGPAGHTKKHTEKYWKKVKAELDKLS